MIKPKFTFKDLFKSTLTTTIFIGSIVTTLVLIGSSISASPGMFEVQWDPDPSFRKLKSLQTSNEKMDRSTYYLFLRSSERKTAILQLTLKLPDYFDAKLKANKISLCQALIGGFKDRTRCIKNIDSVIEIGEDQTSIEIFPDKPIPMDNNPYAVVIKLFNPRSSGMFQFHGYAKSAGAIDVSSYIGSWTFDVK